VAAAAQGPTELIRDRTDGRLAAIDDPASLAAAIGELIDDKECRRALAKAGRERYEADFAETQVVASWRHFLATVEKA